MTSIARRRFLQAGALGIGTGLLEPAGVIAQGGVSRTSVPFQPVSTRVRMTGDGLGLTVAEQGQLLAQLAQDGRID